MQDFIDDVISRAQALGYHLAKGTAVLGSPAATILEQADKLEADVILMGSRGRSGVTRFVLGSVLSCRAAPSSLPRPGLSMRRGHAACSLAMIYGAVPWLSPRCLIYWMTAQSS
ncbi:universal stress protein [Nitrospira sp. Nam80]